MKSSDGREVKQRAKTGSPIQQSAPAGSQSVGARSSRQADGIDAQIAENLKRVRKAAGLSQMELALALGISYQQYQKYERAQNRISGSVLYRSAHILKVSADELLPTRAHHPVAVGVDERPPSASAAATERLDPSTRPEPALGASRSLPAGQTTLSEFAELCERIVALQSPRLKRALLEILEESCANDVAQAAREGSRKASA